MAMPEYHHAVEQELEEWSFPVRRTLKIRFFLDYLEISFKKEYHTLVHKP